MTLREGYSALFCVVVLSIAPSKAIEKKVPPSLSVDSLFRHSRKTLFVYSSTIIRNETPPLHCSVIQRQFLAPLMLFRSVLCDSGPNRLLNSIFKFKEKFYARTAGRINVLSAMSLKSGIHLPLRQFIPSFSMSMGNKANVTPSLSVETQVYYGKS